MVGVTEAGGRGWGRGVWKIKKQEIDEKCVDSWTGAVVTKWSPASHRGSIVSGLRISWENENSKRCKQEARQEFPLSERASTRVRMCKCMCVRHPTSQLPSGVVFFFSSLCPVTLDGLGHCWEKCHAIFFLFFCSLRVWVSGSADLIHAHGCTVGQRRRRTVWNSSDCGVQRVIERTRRDNSAAQIKRWFFTTATTSTFEKYLNNERKKIIQEFDGLEGRQWGSTRDLDAPAAVSWPPYQQRPQSHAILFWFDTQRNRWWRFVCLFDKQPVINQRAQRPVPELSSNSHSLDHFHKQSAWLWRTGCGECEQQRRGATTASSNIQRITAGNEVNQTHVKSSDASRVIM